MAGGVHALALGWEVGSDRIVVRLSSWTAAKQLYRHPELDLADYTLVQRILDDGRIYLDGRSVVGYLEVVAVGGSWYKAKSQELYVSMFHWAGARDLPRAGHRAGRRWPRMR